MIYGASGFSIPDKTTPYANLVRPAKSWDDALKLMYQRFAYLPSPTELVRTWHFPE